MTSGRPESDGAGRFTTKPPKHQGKINREDGEVREKRFHHKGAKGTKREYSPPRHKGTKGRSRAKDIFEC
jgi:hypothetical protein